MGAGSRPSRRSSRVVSWGWISLLWPGERTKRDRGAVGCQFAAANGKLEDVFLVAPVRWREEEKKIGRLLKLEVVVFTTASTAAQQEQEEQEEKEVAHDGITFPFFPRRPHPDSMIHQQFLARPSPVQQARMAPMAPWTLVLRGLPCHGRVCRSLSACQQACFCSEIAARTAKLHCKATPEINQREPRLGWWARRCGWQGTRLAGR